MATEIKLSVTCDRCKRVETREAPDAGSTATPTMFEAYLLSRGGKKHVVAFQDLCGPCENTVMNHLAAIEKKVDKKSPDRASAKKKP